MRSFWTWTLFLGIPLAGAGFAGCGGGGGGGGGGGAPITQGAVRVLIQDAPLADLSSVTVASITVEKIELQASNGSISSGTAATSSGTAPVTSSPSNGNGKGNGKGKGNNGGGGGSTAPTSSGSSTAAPNSNTVAGWYTVFDAAAVGSKTFNLLDLRGGINAELAVANLPAAKYTQMRIVISAAEVVVDGVTYSTSNGMLNITSGQSAGLIIPFQNGDGVQVNAGGMSELLMDVDLSQSFSYVGNPQSPTSFRLSPVIRLANLATSGSLAGMVLSDNGTPADTADDVPLGNATVTATYNGITATTMTDASGVYVLSGLDAGAWDVNIQAAGHNAYDAAGVSVTAGQQTTLDATLTKQ